MATRNPRHLPDNISYERWVEHVFDHPVMDPQWWFRPWDSDTFEFWDPMAKPRCTLAHLTRLFREPAAVVRRYSRAQIDQGLNYLVSGSCSQTMFVLREVSIPWDDRRACLDAMVSLYAKLMAPVYGYDLGHTQRGPNDSARPNFACYMFWDMIPLYGGLDHPDRDRINDAVLGVFEDVLRLRSEACLESVLHGLGHWHLYLPERTEPVVRRFLERSDISDDLRRYAECAAVGAVQ